MYNNYIVRHDNRDDVFYNKPLTTTTLNFPRILDSFVGFDRMFDRLTNFDSGTNYPPFNIRKIDEDSFVIELAVAGFDKSDLTVSEEDGTITVTGEKSEDNEEYVYKGIASRKFTRKFALAEYIYVDNVYYSNGMLFINVVRKLPEEKKPKTFRIK